MKNKLPQQSENQRRGMQAEDILSSVLSKLSFVNRIENSVDIGVDFICERRKEDMPTGNIFNIQCKVVPISWDDSNSKDITYSIKVKTARYWMQLPNITLLMAVNPDNGSVYWSNPIEQLIKRTDDWRAQGKIDIKVPALSSFECFESVPQSLIDIIDNSTNHLSVSLNERLYNVEKIINEEQPKGMFPNAKEVAKELASDSPLQDAIIASEALDNFQSNIYGMLLKRANKYTHHLYSFIDKWFGKHLRRRDIYSSPLDTALDKMIPRVVLDNAKECLKILGENSEERDFKTLLKVLEELETLERAAFKIEAIEWEYEKPMLDILMKNLEASGAKFDNPN